MAEATGSRNKKHKKEAVHRVRDAGALVGSVEMFGFEAMRTAWPDDLPLGVRMNGVDWDDRGLTIEDAIAFVAERGGGKVHTELVGSLREVSSSPPLQPPPPPPRRSPSCL